MERVRAKDIKVHLDPSAVELLIDKGYDPTYGARPMRRAVEKYLEDPLAEELLRGNIKQGDTLDVHTAGQQLAFKVARAGTRRNRKKKGVHGNSPLLQAINYARLFKIVWRHLKLYAITNGKTNESLSHFPT